MKTETKKRLNAGEKRMVARMDEIKTLLAEFGAVLHGYTGSPYGRQGLGWESLTAYLSDPKKQFFMGTAGAGYWGEPIALNGYEWAWLEPLLIELQQKRKQLAEIESGLQRVE